MKARINHKLFLSLGGGVAAPSETSLRDFYFNK